MKLKICGVRTEEMAQMCQDQSIDYIGLNFVSWSKRKVDSEKCNSIAKTFRGQKVGVFMNHALSEIEAILNICDVDILQLHGEENPECVRKIKTKFPKKKVWKAFRITENFDEGILQQYCKIIDKYLFDGAHPGSGETADKNLLSLVTKCANKQNIPYGIAGGIKAENIADFVSRFPGADFLDTASGVEKDGQFNPQTFRALVHNFQKTVS